ncbi:MAG: hypothetical protein U1D35_10800 [Paracoccaceae bacterium]|nr:hypothetical protein [Paracoccaceae bacterium]
MPPMTHHDQSQAIVSGSQSEVFAYLDDQTRLAAHMGKRSMMMLGGRMTYQFDAAQGCAVGSVIRMGGRFLGLSLAVTEVVTKRTPPSIKRWATRGPQRLLVMDSYVMGFDARGMGAGTEVRVFIDYRLPSDLVGRWLGRVFAPIYARWCVSRMVKDARQHFGSGEEPGVAA